MLGFDVLSTLASDRRTPLSCSGRQVEDGPNLQPGVAALREMLRFRCTGEADADGPIQYKAEVQSGISIKLI